ncbi:MAG: hypothetical protein ACRDBP_09650 [Luteolibacter sp.]
MSGHEPNEVAAGIPLKAHVDELRSRCEAVARFQGGSTHYLEELAIFRTYAAEKGLILAQPPAELSRTPDDEGNEHQVWFDADSACFLKATWPGFFGLLVIHRQNEEPKASPIAYLERWLLHNELFGDDVRFLGAVEVSGQQRMLIRQPAIAGEPATLEEIDSFFTGNGWLRFSVGGETAFFDPEKNVAISDTHRGNLILMDDGLLAPIDLRVQSLSGALLATVVKLCQFA